MTDTTTPDLQGLVAVAVRDALAAAGVTVPDPAAAPTPALIPGVSALPVDVTAGELIESSWGNAVANWVQAADPMVSNLWTWAAVNVQGFLATPSTNAAGVASITFPQPFSAAPTSIALTNGDMPQGMMVYGIQSRSNTSFAFYTYDPNTGQPYGSRVISVFVTAVGPR